MIEALERILEELLLQVALRLQRQVHVSGYAEHVRRLRCELELEQLYERVVQRNQLQRQQLARGRPVPSQLDERLISEREVRVQQQQRVSLLAVVVQYRMHAHQLLHVGEVQLFQIVFFEQVLQKE